MMYVDVHYIMNQTVSITNLRNNIFSIFSSVEINKNEIVIVKDGKEIALIKPLNKKEFDWNQYKRNVDKAVSHLSKFDWSDVLKVRKKTKARRYKKWSM